jgi:hypothetical protein
MNTLCFSTYAYGWYRGFIPAYVFSILHEFPQHFVKIFLPGELPDKEKRVLDTVRAFNGNFQIVEHYSLADQSQIKHLPAIRYLLPRKEFADFQYVYLGDVDFIIFNEHNDDFIGYYRNHCESTGLPFSNSITHDNGKERMTGLHFFEVAPYYDQTEPAMAEIIRGNEFVRARRDSLSFDEEMLYYVLNKTFDLRVLRGFVRPNNGLHFGYVRGRPPGCSYIGKDRIRFWRQHLPKINAIVTHPIFEEIKGNFNEPVADLYRRVLDVLYRPVFL